jgi:hypothetical protein
MKRGKKMSANEAVATRDFVKATYLLDPAMKENLQFIALHRRREQSDLVREAIGKLIKDAGLDPERSPLLDTI